MNLTNDEIRKFQGFIEGPLKETLQREYPSYMTNYLRFRERVGPQCPFCKSAAKTMFSLEVTRKGQDFLTRFNEGNWNGY